MNEENAEGASWHPRRSGPREHRDASASRKATHIETMPMPSVISIAGLRLRTLSVADVDDVHRLMSLHTHTISGGPHSSTAETRTWLERREWRFRNQGLAWYGIWTETFIGTCGVFLGERCGDEPEIGYEIAPDFRRRGYARQAAAVVTDTAHSAGHPRLWATIRPANEPSIKVVRSLGYGLDRTETDDRGSLEYYLSRAFTD